MLFIPRKFYSHSIYPTTSNFSNHKCHMANKSCFIGAGSGIGPGCVVEDGTKLPVQTNLMVNKRVGPKDFDQKDIEPVEEFLSRG